MEGNETPCRQKPTHHPQLPRPSSRPSSEQIAAEVVILEDDPGSVNRPLEFFLIILIGP